MKFRLSAAMCVLCLLVATGAAGQGSIAGQSKIFGNLDRPSSGATVSRATLTFQGWALSCSTAQQPSDVEVWFYGAATANGVRPIQIARLDGVWQFTSAGYARVSSAAGLQIAWRGRRPDVTAVMSHYCNLLGDRWGYALRLTGELPLGANVLAIRFFDPSIGIAVNDQQIYLNVVP